MISVGIDVSKEKSTVCIMKPGGEILAAPFDVFHTMKDVLALVELLKSYNEEVRVVLESTGHYHWPVVSVLVVNGIFVSCVNALRMKKYFAELGDIRRFTNGSALIAYAGIDAPPYQSGTFTGTKRSISKRGNKYLRKTGYETMQSVMRKKPTDDSAVYQFIQKKLSEGKRGKTAMIAGLNKFLRIYYARVTEVYRQTDEQLGIGCVI